MYNHHLAVNVFISNMPQRTTKGCQLNTVLDKQLVVHNYFSHQQKTTSADDQRSAPNIAKKGWRETTPCPEKKTAEFPISASLLFSWIFNSSTSQEWLPEFPGFQDLPPGFDG